MNGQNGVKYTDSPDEYMAERSETLISAGISTEVILTDEPAADALVGVEEEHPTHIVVMAGGRRKTFNRAFFGYAITRLVRTVSNPIIFLPPGYEPPIEEKAGD